jgi:hypothetical protein
MKARIKDLTFGRGGEQIITFALASGEDFRTKYDALNDKDVRIEVKQYRERRSLNANNYAWELITKIADKMRLSKDDLYIKMLKDYGQSEMISVLSSIDIAPYLKYYEEAGQSTLNGKDFTHYRVYKGSSEFDTREMSIFIDGIVQEAKNLGIETMTPNQIAEMESAWNDYTRPLQR